jgi:hypothetical protein
VSAVGALLLEQFKVARVYKRFGFGRLRDFIDSIDSVGVDSAGLVVMRKSGNGPVSSSG